MAFDIREESETEDHYVITLSYRPQGDFAGEPGQEQFFIEKEGVVVLRQILSLAATERVDASATPQAAPAGKVNERKPGPVKRIEYTCEDCQTVSEAIRKMVDADAVTTCQNCGSRNTHRTHSLFAAGASTRRTTSQTPPITPCGRCGDPGGSCGV